MENFQIKNMLYYLLIGIISLLVLIFVPMLGSNIEGGFAFPENGAEWSIFILTKLIVAILNIMIFYCFMQQAKINVKDNNNYKSALDILGKVKNKQKKPRSPSKWNAQQYGGKATSIFITSITSTIVFTQAILSYDWISLLTYLFVLTLGIIFGILQMKDAETYWSTEFYEYALMIQTEEQNKEKEENSQCISKMESNIEI